MFESSRPQLSYQPLGEFHLEVGSFISFGYMNYSKENPYTTSIKSRLRLTKPGSKKMTQHVVIDLGDSGIRYTVGDSLGVIAENRPDIVEKTLKALKCEPATIIQDKRTGNSFTLEKFLTTKANLRTVNRKFAERAEAPHLTKEELEQYEVWDFLEAYPDFEISPQEFCDLLMLLLPRLYSIASSPSLFPNEIHLTVAPVCYETRGVARYGVATNFLCDQAEIGVTKFGIYLQPHHGFTLPEQATTDIIMVGPGTGVAPYRAFMQERVHQKSPAKHWLFFGEWNQATDFFYEEDWKEIASQCNFRLDCAFSRDQQEKIYVQDRLKSHSKEIFNWLENGAIFYVCGDAQRMAKDVEQALQEIIKENSAMDDVAARSYLKKLRTDKRYLRDIY